MGKNGFNQWDSFGHGRKRRLLVKTPHWRRIRHNFVAVNENAVAWRHFPMRNLWRLHASICLHRRRYRAANDSSCTIQTDIGQQEFCWHRSQCGRTKPCNALIFAHRLLVHVHTQLRYAVFGRDIRISLKCDGAKTKNNYPKLNEIANIVAVEMNSHFRSSK